MSTLLQINYMLFQAINVHAGQIPWLDALMVFSANTLIFFWLLLLLIVWGIPSTWRKHTLQPGEIELIRARRTVVLWVAFASLLAYGINLLIEQFVFEPRPFISHRVHLLVSHVPDSGFPSDHTAWSFAVVGMLLFVLLPAFRVAARIRADSGQTVRPPTPQRYVPLLRNAMSAPLDIRSLPRHTVSGGDLTASTYAPFPTYIGLSTLLIIVAFVMACLIGFARIFVGLHYPGDVLAGAIDGLIAASIITWLSRRLCQPTDAVLRLAQTLRLA